MTQPSDLLLDVAAALSDGAPIDWDAVESSAGSDAERRQICSLRLVRRLADAHGSASLAGHPSAVHDSILHPAGAAGAAAEDLPPVMWGPLRVIEKIGRGRFGDVYRARDSRLDRDVALKLLRRRTAPDDGLGSTVIEEGRLLAKVRHPNVVTVHGAEQIDGRVGVWMELVRGRTLDDELAACGPLPPDDVRAIGIDVCRALAAVHRAGLVHRDIKAQNVMRDLDGRVVLMDFGTGRELDASGPIDLAGTPLYLAPEVLAGGIATPQSDLYSVGVLLYHLATGEFPVKGRTLAGVRKAHADRIPPDLSDLVGVSKDVKHVISRALAPDSGNRWDSAAEMARALGEARPAAGRARSYGRIAVPAVLLLLIAVALVIISSVWVPGAPAASTAPGAAGLQARQVWTGTGVDGSGSPSPDGRYLTFTDWETGDLALRDFVTGTTRRLTNTGGWEPSGDYVDSSVISPDGRQVAYLWFVERTLSWELRVQSLAADDAAGPRVIARQGRRDYLRPVAWTSDQTRLVVVRSPTGRLQEIGVLSIQDGGYGVVKQLDWRAPALYRASLSPDDRFIAFDLPASEPGSPRDLFVVALDGGLDEVLLQSPANDQSPAWAPDGSGVVFLSDRTGTTSLWWLPIAAGQATAAPSLLKSDLGRIEPLGFSSNGALFYFVSGTERRNIQTAELDQLRANTAPVLGAERFVNSNVGPTWSPDGRYLAFYSFRPEPTLVVRATDTGEERDFPLPSSLLTPFNSGPRWFPDNRSVLILCRESDGVGRAFFRFHLDTGERELLHRVQGLSSFTLAPDGRAIYYAVQSTNAISFDSGLIVRYDIDAGRSSILRRDEWIIAVAVSPDGRQVAYLKSERRRGVTSEFHSVVSVVPAEGWEAREIFRDPHWVSGHRYNTLAWTPDGGSLMFVRDDGALWRAPLDGGAPQAMGISMTARIKSPAVHPDGSRIVFGTVEADDNDVWVLENFLPARPAPAAATVGMSVQQVWAGDGVNLSGRPSPDGRSIVYIDWPSEGNVAIRGLATGTRRLLTREANRNGGHAEAPVFSPDGRFVAYTWDEAATFPLRIMAVDGSSSRTVYQTDRLVPIAAGWSPDGRHLAVSIQDLLDHTSSIALLSVADGRLTTLREAGTRGVHVGGFSSDGRWVVYSIGHGASARDGGIFAAAVDGSGEVLLARSGANDRAPRWTPNGRAVVFQSDRTGTDALWMVGVEEGRPVGEPEILKRDTGTIETMGFTSDGSYFYGTRNWRIDPYVAGFDPETLAVTTSPRRLTDVRQGSNHGPAWSPDGRLVAFIRGPRESSTLVIKSADGEERPLPTRIEDGLFAARFGVDWFPDSRSVLLQDWVDDRTRKIFRQVDVATGSDRVIHEGSSHTWSAVRLSPDGKDLFYSVWESAQAVDEAAPLRLFRRDLETGDTVELFQMRSDGIGFFGLCVSPDGRQLAFSANAAPGERLLMTLPTAGGEPRVILRGTYSNPAPATMTWTRDGRYILFTAPEGNGSGPRTALWAVPTEGGAPRQLNLEMPSLLSLSLAPDGRQLAFSTSESAAEIWVIRNLLR